MIQDPAVPRAGAGPAASPARGGTSANHMLSQDGKWWWNGRRWVAAVTEDGLWRWDGTRWIQTTSLDGKRPEDLATTLRLLAEDRYAEAGVVLAERSGEWSPQGGLREVVQRAQAVRFELSRLQETVSRPQGGRGLLGLRAEDRPHAQAAQDELVQEQRALAVRVGRAVTPPTVKEADDVLAAAALLDERAALLIAGLAEVDEAERIRADAAVAAQKDLAAAEDARLKALQQARRSIEAAESAHAHAVSEARAHLAAVLNPGLGDLRMGLGPLRLYDTVLEGPSGRLSAAGLRAFVDTAVALWRDHREPLADLLAVLQTDEADRFRAALTQRSGDLFILILATNGTTLLACPVGQELAARRFAAAVRDHAGEAARAKTERQARADQADAALDAVIRDRSQIEAAEAELARVEADPALQGAIDDARKRLERARADTPEVIEARRKLQELARRLVAPPEPLPAVR
jgi:hypothetical protein